MPCARSSTSGSNRRLRDASPAVGPGFPVFPGDTPFSMSKMLRRHRRVRALGMATRAGVVLDDAAAADDPLIALPLKWCDADPSCRRAMLCEP